MITRAIYVTHQGARLQRKNGTLSAAIEGKTVEHWPIDEVGRVLVFGNVQITTQAMSLLLDRGVDVQLFSATGRYRGRIASPESGNIFLRLAQHARLSDMAFRLDFSRALVLDKIAASRDALLRHRRNHPEVADPLEGAAARLLDLQGGAAAAGDLDVLRGVEGAAAAAYFGAFDTMVRGRFAFERRSRRPAHNALNALLNLGYVMVTMELTGRLEAAGFDPRVGYFHGVRYGRASLALDLVEVHRVPVVDRLTLSLINRRALTPEDFHDAGGVKGVRLNPSALRRYLAAYEEALGALTLEEDTPRARMEAQIQALRARVMTPDPPRPDDHQTPRPSDQGGGDP